MTYSHLCKLVYKEEIVDRIVDGPQKLDAANQAFMKAYPGTLDVQTTKDLNTGNYRVGPFEHPDAADAYQYRFLNGTGIQPEYID